MLHAIARNWWMLLIRGIFAVLFGVLALVWPGITLYALVILWGAYALVDGVAAIALGFSGRGEPRVADLSLARSWGAMIAVGVLGVAAGIVTFLWPGITALALLVIIAITAIFRGIAEIAAAVRLRKVIEHEWLLGLGGALSVAFGVLLLVRPMAGALALVWVIGAWAILFGVVSIALSFRLRAHRGGVEGHGGKPAVGVV